MVTLDSQVCIPCNSNEHETEQPDLDTLLRLQKRWLEEFQILGDYWEKPIKPTPERVRIAAAFIGSVFGFSDDWIDDSGRRINP
jgi:hypothetical protein